MSKLGLGVIGCGKHAQRSHIEVADDFEVTALFDPSPESIAVTQQLLAGGEAVVCKTEAELLARDDVDAVLIASLDKNHATQLSMAVEAGKPVLCDKPLAISAQDMGLVEKALSLAEESSLVVASCHPRRDRHEDLAYGWVSASLPALEERFGRLERVWLSSIYPRPSQGWKEERSFLLDKYVHDIDFLLRLRPGLHYEAQRLMDSFDHYGVRGVIGDVEFDSNGTRLHGADGEFIEIILLGFAPGKTGRRSNCAVYSKTGLLRFYDAEADHSWKGRISPMESRGYDRVFSALMKDFAESIRGGRRTHTLDELRVINASAVALAGPTGSYRNE